jgi:hypothetical protein
MVYYTAQVINLYSTVALTMADFTCNTEHKKTDNSLQDKNCYMR